MIFCHSFCQTHSPRNKLVVAHEAHEIMVLHIVPGRGLGAGLCARNEFCEISAVFLYGLVYAKKI